MATDRLTAARAAAGLSQAALARAAGVSRPLVAAVEAGRQSPSVHAALALAGALGTSVEALFGDGPAHAPAATVGRAPQPGEGVLLARVGATPVRVAAPPLGGAAEGWAAADAVADDAGALERPFADGGREGVVVAGCDPALGLAAALSPRRGPHRVVAVALTSAGARAALAAGHVHAALVHGPADHDAGEDGALRVALPGWAVGLAVAPGARASLPALFDGPIVQREAEASAQRALERRLATEGRPTPDGPRASGHLDGARRVVAGASAALTMEPAARACGLGFVPLEAHAVTLLVRGEHRAHPGVEALVELLTSGAFAARLRAVGGYEVAA